MAMTSVARPLVDLADLQGGFEVLGGAAAGSLETTPGSLGAHALAMEGAGATTMRSGCSGGCCGGGGSTCGTDCSCCFADPPEN